MCIILFYECFACMYVGVPHICPGPTEVRKGHPVPQNWSYRLLWVTMWVLEWTWCAARAVSALNGWAIAPASVCSLGWGYFAIIFLSRQKGPSTIPSDSSAFFSTWQEKKRVFSPITCLCVSNSIVPLATTAFPAGFLRYAALSKSLDHKTAWSVVEAAS